MKQKQQEEAKTINKQTIKITKRIISSNKYIFWLENIFTTLQPDPKENETIITDKIKFSLPEGFRGIQQECG